MSSKTCTKCGESKELEEFARDRHKRDGRRSACKVCHREYAARYHAERSDDPEYRAADRERSARYYAENADQLRERKARYRAERSDDPEYRAANRERCARWRAENPEYAARWRAENPEYFARWARENPDRVAAKSARRRARKASVRTEPYDRTELFERWGYTCCYCDAPAEHVEHITPISKGGDDVLSNLTVACATCNSSKGSKSLAQWAIDSLDLK